MGEWMFKACNDELDKMIPGDICVFIEDDTFYGKPINAKKIEKG